MVIKPLDMVKIINEWCEKRHLYYADFQKNGNFRLYPFDYRGEKGICSHDKTGQG